MTDRWARISSAAVTHAGAAAADLADRHRPGNGVRVHRTYIVIVSLVALVLLGVAIAVTSTRM